MDQRTNRQTTRLLELLRAAKKTRSAPIQDQLPTSLCWGVVLYSFLFFLMAGVRKAAESESLHVGGNELLHVGVMSYCT